MKKRISKIPAVFKFLGIIVLIACFLGFWIVSSHNVKKSTVELNENVAFEKDRTILKMKKDSLLMILQHWQKLKASKFVKIDFEKGDTNDWILWKYNKRYEKGIVEEILGDEVAYKKTDQIFIHDKEQDRLKIKVVADTAYVYVRFMTQYYSLLD